MYGSIAYHFLRFPEEIFAQGQLEKRKSLGFLEKKVFRFFTARCTIVHSAVLRLHDVRLSVLSVCPHVPLGVGGWLLGCQQRRC